jgi:hypothetical protein
MNKMNCENVSENRRNERGEGSFKVIVFLAALVLGGFAGSQYVPVAYNAAALKQEMQTVVDQSSAVPAARENQGGWVQKKIETLAPDYGAPKDAKLEVRVGEDMGITASMKFTTPVSILPFGLYEYPYEFSHTAKTSTMLTK